MIRRSTLSCGVRVLTDTMPDVRSATVGIWADVGSALEAPAQRGISHLVEHMVFKGTEHRDARTIAETIDGVGGDLNAFTDKEATCYYARVMDHHVPLAVDVICDMFLHSIFDPEEIAREQRVIFDEIKMYDDSPDDMIHDLFVRTLWRGSQLGEPTIGYAPTVAALDRRELREHMRRHYAPDAVIVAAAGNIDHDAFVALLEPRFASFAGSAERVQPESPVYTPDVLIRTKDTEQAYVLVGTQGLSLRDDDRYALALLDTVLGGGMSSRLFQEVRERRGLAYSVYSFQQAYRGGGLFGISAGCSPENVQECVDVIVAQVAAVAREGITPRELTLAREHLKGSMTLSLESTVSRMMRLARNELVYERDISSEEVERAVDRVTLADVGRLAHTLFAHDALGLCILGPLDPDDIRFSASAAA